VDSEVRERDSNPRTSSYSSAVRQGAHLPQTHARYAPHVLRLEGVEPVFIVVIPAPFTPSRSASSSTSTSRQKLTAESSL
jgi:hypothetical protein